MNSNGKSDVCKMNKNEPVMYAKYSYMKWGTVHCLKQYNKRVGSRYKNKDLLLQPLIKSFKGSVSERYFGMHISQVFAYQ